MNDDANPRRRATITVRPTTEEKERLTALARARGVSESELALRALRSMVGSLPPEELPFPKLTTSPAVDRITIRLRPGDRLELRMRAQRRDMQDSSYLAALVRAHLTAKLVLPTSELEYLKQRLGQLSWHYEYLGRLMKPDILARLTTPQLMYALKDTQTAVRDVRYALGEYVRVALKSWESHYDR